MPSRKQVEVLVLDDDDAASGEAAPASNPSTEEATATTASAKKSAKPKITPATDKKTPAVKSKSQLTLASFFGGSSKRKTPSSPLMNEGASIKKANNNNGAAAAKPASAAKSSAAKKGAATTGALATKGTNSSKKQVAGSVTPHSNSKAAASASASTGTNNAPDTVAEGRRKSDLREIVLGRLQPPPDNNNKNDVVSLSMDLIEQSPENNTSNNNTMEEDSLLPAIPSVKSCRTRPPSTSTKKRHDKHGSPEDSLDVSSQTKTPLEAMSQDTVTQDSEAASGTRASNAAAPGYKRLRSQLVDKFEEDLTQDWETYASGEHPMDTTTATAARKENKPMMQVEGTIAEQPVDTTARDEMEIDNYKEPPDANDESISMDVEVQPEGIDNKEDNISPSQNENDVAMDVPSSGEVQTAPSAAVEQPNEPTNNGDDIVNLCDLSLDGDPEGDGEETAENAQSMAPSVEAIDVWTPSAAPTKDKPESAKKSGKPAFPATGEPAVELDSESLALVEKHEAMRIKYCEEAIALVNQAGRGLEEEEIDIEIPLVDNKESVVIGSEFPDAAVPQLVSIVEGSRLPLAELAKQACEKLNDAFGQSGDGSDSCFSFDCVSSKIKILATRKAYVKNPAVASGLAVSNTVSADTDIFDDQNNDHMWRWEVISVEILPEAAVGKVKKARAARKKLSSHFNATAKLLATLDECIKILKEGKSSSKKQRLDKLLGKVTQEEEKVLKYERDAEKARLVADAKKKKLVSKNQKSKEEKEKEKERKKEEAEQKKLEKEKEKERKKKEAEERKLEKEKEKERKKKEAAEAKRQKALEKEEKERQAQQQLEQLRSKQEKIMMSFFGQPKVASKKEEPPAEPLEEVAPASDETQKEVKSDFDSESFRSRIDSAETHPTGPYFKSLSSRAIASRVRKTKNVSVRVFVTSQLQAPDPFGPPTFDEEKVIQVPNKYKYLRFHEDLRPPYHGTWSKKSKIVSGKNPFGKDTTHLDYDNDSEAEWEEGDDEIGEDVDNDDGDDEEPMIDEEGDPLKYNYQDGWLAEDDDLGDEEVDEETLKMRKQKLEEANRRDATRGAVPVCIVAPSLGGLPVTEVFTSPAAANLAERVEGFCPKEAHELVTDHYVEQLAELDVFLDAFPPNLVDESEAEQGTEASASAAAKSLAQEPSGEDLKVIARFVHHKNFQSKSQLIEELRSTHGSVTTSRAQAQRTLDAIAEKMRNSKVKNGVYWAVKTSVIEDLGLDDLKKMELPVEEVDAPKPKEEKTEKPKRKAKAKAKPAPKEKAASPPTSGSKKRKHDVPAGSANVLAAFLKKKKV